MANRFDVYTPIRSTFMPREFIPNFAALDAALGEQQRGFDVAQAAADKVPQHLKHDVDAITQYRSELDNAMSSVAEAYKNQGLTAGNRARRDLIRQVERDWQPGGRADVFQKRLAKFQTIAENIKKTYEDQPLIQNYYLNKLDKEGVQPYIDPDSGSYGDVISPTGMVRHVDAKEMSEWLNKAIDNIKDTDLKRLGISKVQLANFNYLYKTGKITGREYTDIVQTLAQQMPEEFIRSAQQYSNALGRDVDETSFLSSEGMPNVQTTLGRIIAGGARGRARQDLDLKTGTFKDDWALKKFELDYDKQKSFYEFPSSSETVLFDPQTEKQQLSNDLQGLKIAQETINAYQQKLASGETATPEEQAEYENAIRLMSDSNTALKARQENMITLLDKTGFNWDQAMAGNFGKTKPDVPFLKEHLPELIAGTLRLPGISKRKLDNLAEEVVNHLDKNKDQLQLTRNYTLMEATSNTELARRNKAMTEAFLKGNIGFTTIDGKDLADPQVIEKLRNGELALVDIKEAVNGKPTFAIVSTIDEEGNFFRDGEYGKEITYVNLVGDQSMVVEQEKRIARDMYFNGDETDQNSAAWKYGFFTQAPNTSLTVGEQINALDLERKPSGWESDVPIKTPVGDVYIRKFVDRMGNTVYGHELYKTGTKERMIDPQTNEPIYNLFTDPSGLSSTPGEIIKVIGEFQLQSEAQR